MEHTEEENSYPLWVNWESKVISFREAEGFARLDFPTHQEMFRFAIEKGFEGFGIQ